MTQQEICTRFRERQAAADNQLSHKATLRAAAREAGAETFVIPLCGGGFTGHHISTETNKCVDCGPLRDIRNAAAASAAAKAARAIKASIKNQQHSATSIDKQKDQSK